MFGEALERVIDACNANIRTNDGDYVGEDGLLYCGQCHTRKQTEIMLFGEVRRPMCLCSCEQERLEREKQEQKKRELEEKIKRYRKIGFPRSDMYKWTFENDDKSNEELTEAMKRYVNHFPELLREGKGLLLHGSVGTGKTYAACEVANALINKGYPVLVTNFSRITNTVQGMFEGRQEYIDSLNDFALLVLDDLGAERESSYMQEMVYTIIDSRYRAGLPMIVTTNISIEQIKKTDNMERMRIYDRILERCFPIDVSGSSKRRRIVRNNYESMKEILGL
ncbi:MAG: ATP-binding protein [Clostridiales bacterium]|nr:ATP-binding protein [Clostridiales bacterium]